MEYEVEWCSLWIRRLLKKKRIVACSWLLFILLLRLFFINSDNTHDLQHTNKIALVKWRSYMANPKPTIIEHTRSQSTTFIHIFLKSLDVSQHHWLNYVLWIRYSFKLFRCVVVHTFNTPLTLNIRWWRYWVTNCDETSDHDKRLIYSISYISRCWDLVESKHISIKTRNICKRYVDVLFQLSG